MKAIEIKARKHFKNVKAGKFKPTFSPGLAASESALVWVGDVPLPLEDYYNCLAARDRAEAQTLVRPPKSLDSQVPTQEEKDASTKAGDLNAATPRISKEAGAEGRKT